MRPRKTRFALRTVAAATAVVALAGPDAHAQRARPSAEPSPIYGVTVPRGARTWTLIAPALEAAPLDELRAVVGNRKAMRAYRTGARPFPDGTILVKFAWRRTPSADFGPASVPGAATTVQVMVKDSKRYAATGGWGFGRFTAGQPADRAEHETCFACHAARVSDRDFVFTRYAP